MANSEQAIYVNINTEEVKSATDALDKELLVLRLALGKLRAAIINAVAPIGAVFIPVVQKAVWAATRLVKAVGKVVAALFGQGAAAQSTAKKQTALASSNEKVKRSLMGFDEINRLDAAGGGTGTTEDNSESAATDTLTPQLQAVVDKILSLTAPLNQIDFAPAAAAFGRLKEAIAPISQALFAGLEWAWFNLLVPLAAWTIEDLLPAFLDVLASALGVLNEVIVALQPAASWLWETFLKPLGQWAGERIIEALGWLRERLDGISVWISENRELVQKIALAAAAIGLVNGVIKIFNSLSGTAIGVMGGFGGAIGGLMNPFSLVLGAVKSLSGAILLLIGNWDGAKIAATASWGAIQSLFAGAAGWLQKTLLTPLSNGFKNTVNGIIGFLNGLIAGMVSAVNGIVGAVNKLSFAVPDWIPGIGGKTLGFHLKTVNTPRIPYLAQGAVLPANKPFLAVVGDQKHGTNVEAPLATIQQAVALVMGEQTSAIMAGFSASVEVQRDILQAVLGIQIGDDIIGNAVSRYQRKMAVVNGGML